MSMMGIVLSFGLVSCASMHQGKELESDEPRIGKEIVVIDYPIPKIPRRINPEHMMQYKSISESKRKRVMDASLRAFSRLSVTGKDWEKYKKTVSFVDDYLEKVGYYRDMQKKGYVPAFCHPFEPWILFVSKHYPCMCFDIYQTLQNNPSYLNGEGVKGFSRMLTYYCQYNTGCGKAVCNFPEQFLREIGVYSMEALPLNENERLSESARFHYKKELRRVYYTKQDESLLFSSHD